MLADVDWTGIGAAFAGGAVLVTALGGVIMQFRTAAKITDTHSTVQDVKHDTGQIDRAVNGQPPGTTTMVQQMQDLTDKNFPPQEPVNGNENAMLPTLQRIEAFLKAQAEREAGK